MERKRFIKISTDDLTVMLAMAYCSGFEHEDKSLALQALNVHMNALVTAGYIIVSEQKEPKE